MENPKTGEIDPSALSPDLAEIAALWLEWLLLYRKKIVKIFAEKLSRLGQDVACWMTQLKQKSLLGASVGGEEKESL